MLKKKIYVLMNVIVYVNLYSRLIIISITFYLKNTLLYLENQNNKYYLITSCEQGVLSDLSYVQHY